MTLKEWLSGWLWVSISFLTYHVGYYRGRRRLKKVLERAGSSMADRV